LKNKAENKPHFVPDKLKNTGIYTKASHIGRRTKDEFGFINTPVYHGSTVCFPTAKSMRDRDAAYTYGLKSTPTIDALTDSLSELENAAGTCLQPSGLSAIISPLLAILEAGDHLLITDSVYQPTRIAATRLLSKLGIEVEYYDPLVGGAISQLFKSNTRAVLLESPGSQTFEMQDIDAIVEACKTKNIITLIDNTWASPLYYQPLSHGIDISINAGTKYLSGHSDLLLGYVSTNEKLWQQVSEMNYIQGLSASADDVSLALRGLRTMPLRMERHYESGMIIADWLEDRPEVAQVLHPALESHPQHHLWEKSFSGANGLFSFILNDYTQEAVDNMVDHLDFFGLGYSWGGFESLVVSFDPTSYRTVTKWEAPGPALRLHIGLEDPRDLIADLEKGFERLRSFKS